MKMWTGRFKGTVDEQADKFNSSLPFDKRLYKHDIMGSIAHVTMLYECGIIPQGEGELIAKTLSEIFYDIKAGRIAVCDAEDIHMFVEEELTKRIGDVGKKLHTGRSRNDQVALDFRLYLRDSCDDIALLLKKLCDGLLTLAEENTLTLIPAYTHMQKAQPSTLGHYFMAYVEMFTRDITRFFDCKRRMNVLPLGSGACCGTTFPINRNRVKEILNFDDISNNSLDAVSDRDFVIEFLSACATLAMHLSRFNEEIIYWSTDEFGYITLPDRFSTGSSIMPQKKNPDMCELIRGKTGRIYGNLFAILTVMKGLPLAYNKDMQEDKEPVFDTEDTIKASLSIFTAMIAELKFNKDRLNIGAYQGFTVATDVADYLVRQGLPFRDAHSVSGKLVLYCSENKKRLDELTLEEFVAYSPLFKSDILSAIKMENVVHNRKIPGAPGEKAVTNSIKKTKKTLEKLFYSIKEKTIEL